MDLSRFETNPAIYAGMPPAQLAYILSQYAGEIRATDEYLGRLFALLKREGLWSNTAILITADHGEEFFDHGEKGHKNNLFAETIHVPLLLKLPEIASGRVDGRLASHVDVLPTLLELAGVRPDFPIQGRSLLEAEPAREPRDLLRSALDLVLSPPGRIDVRRDPALARRASSETGSWCGATAARARRCARSTTRRSDPADRSDVLGRERSRGSRSLEALFQAQQKESEAIAAPHPPGGSAELSPRELESLRALGYVDP